MRQKLSLEKHFCTKVRVRSQLCEELREFKDSVNDVNAVGKNANTVVLWTSKGAARHCKMRDTARVRHMGPKATLISNEGMHCV